MSLFFIVSGSLGAFSPLFLKSPPLSLFPGWSREENWSAHSASIENSWYSSICLFKWGGGNTAKTFHSNCSLISQMVWWTQNLRFFRWSFVWRRSWNLRLRLHRRRQGELWQLLREVPSPVEERGSHRYRQRKAFSRRAFYHKQLDPLTRFDTWPCRCCGVEAC